jgi:hypothetical protein
MRNILRNFKRKVYYGAFLIRRLFRFGSEGAIADISKFEWKVYSEDGEDGILQGILAKLGTTNKFCVEFGAGDGIGCNTGLLVKNFGWNCLHMDWGGNSEAWVKQEKVTAENINDLFNKYGVPAEFDVLSIDIDSNDYWIWKAIQGYSPRIVVIEYNASIPVAESRAVEYDPNLQWDGSNYFGASLKAMTDLGKQKGYTLIGCNSKGVNAFFVRNDLVNNNFKIRDITDLYREPAYGVKANGKFIGHPVSNRQMINV